MAKATTSKKTTTTVNQSATDAPKPVEVMDQTEATNAGGNADLLSEGALQPADTNSVDAAAQSEPKNSSEQIEVSTTPLALDQTILEAEIQNPKSHPEIKGNVETSTTPVVQGKVTTGTDTQDAQSEAKSDELKMTIYNRHKKRIFLETLTKTNIKPGDYRTITVSRHEEQRIISNIDQLNTLEGQPWLFIEGDDT